MQKTKQNIVIGQRVAPDKVAQAQRLRQQMTEEEKRLWQRLKGNRLAGLHFRRQLVIDGFIVDFYCHAVGLVLEVDGHIHERQSAYDAERDRILRARGLHILRIPNAAIRADIESVVQKIRGYLDRPPDLPS